MKKILLSVLLLFVLFLGYIVFGVNTNQASDNDFSFESIRQAQSAPQKNKVSKNFSNGWTALETGAPRYNGKLPLMIFCHAVKEEFGPTYCYERVSNIKSIDVDDKNQKMAMCLSLSECEQALSYSDSIKILGYNPEGGHTPQSEMNSLFSSDKSNAICQFSKKASDAGMIPIVGPIRNNISKLPAEFLVKECGLRGIAMQEQKSIEDRSSTADGRYKTVEKDAIPYLQAAKEIGVEFQIHVQIMEERCPDLQKCQDFVSLLTQNPNIWSLAIWPSQSGISSQFVAEMRNSR